MVQLLPLSATPVLPARGNHRSFLGKQRVLFAGSRVLKKRQQKEIESYLPNLDYEEPVAGVDLGGNSIKMFLRRKDRQGKWKIHLAKYLVDNGKSIGEHGKITKSAKKVLQKAARKILKLLKKYDVEKANMNAAATAGLRAAENGTDMLAMIQEMGIPMRIIGGMEESHLIYTSVLKGVPVKKNERMLVIEIGGGSAELAFGIGPDDSKLQESLVRVLPLGTTRLGLAEPFDVQAVKSIRSQVKAVLTGEGGITSKHVRAAKGRRVYIKPSNFQEFREYHLEQTGEDIFENGLKLGDIEHYLKPRNLTELEEELDFGSDTRDPIKLITKLVVLREVLKSLELSEIHFGFWGGMKYALLEKALENAAGT